MTTSKDKSSSDKRKLSCYFPSELLEELNTEAQRLDRTQSWLLQRAWKIALKEIKKIPSIPE